MRKNHGDSPNLKEPPEADILPFAPQRLEARISALATR
jgi:hypothetical protein